MTHMVYIYALSLIEVVHGGFMGLGSLKFKQVRLGALALGLAVLLSSCGGGKEESPAVMGDGKSSRKTPEEFVNGPKLQLEARLKMLQADTKIANCMLEDTSSRLAMLRDLDSKEPEIRAFIAANPTSNFTLKKLGPIEVRAQKEKPVPVPGKVDSVSITWKSITDDYQVALKSGEIGREWSWVLLDADALLLAAQEALDAKYAYWYENSYVVNKNLPAIYDKITNCSSYCSDLQFSPDELAAIADTDVLSAHVRALIETTSVQKRIDARAFFLEEYSYSLSTNREKLRVNPGITRKSSTLRVPLMSGFFKGYETEVAASIEPYWSVLGRVLKVDWKPSGDLLAFLFEFLPDSTQRAYVDRMEKKIHIQNQVREKTLPHEIGHVLGFVDYYYETYRPSLCRWKSESIGDDLMSDSNSGSVLEKHWKMLEEAYPSR